MVAPRATATSYVVLSLLSLRSWSAYELAQQSVRTFRWVLPRAERAVYLEVKRLVQMGWAQVTEESTGRRARHVYAITAEGSEALRTWLADATQVHTRVSSDVLLRIFLADQAPAGSVEAALREVARQADDHLQTMASMATRPSPFPERLATNMLALSFLAEANATIRTWATSAADALEVLDGGDAEAVEAQTAALIDRITHLAARPD